MNSTESVRNAQLAEKIRARAGGPANGYDRPANGPAPIAAAPRPTASRMTISNVKKGRIARPVFTLLYGVEKIGKSSWAAESPNPIFLGTEDGTSELDVSRLPEATSFTDILDGIRCVVEEPHDYTTLVIDTVDWAEPLIHAHVCKANRWSDIEEPGYGKGYTAALDQWRVVLEGLKKVRSQRGMNVLLLGHATIRPFNNPTGENYDRFVLKMNEKAAGLLKEYADDVLFANYHSRVEEKKRGKQKYGVSTGARYVYTEKRPAWDAGNRHSLPEVLPLSWSDYWEAVQAHQAHAPDRIVAQVEADLAAIGDDEFAKTVRAYVATVRDDGEKLSRAANRVAARLGLKEDATNETAKET